MNRHLKCIDSQREGNGWGVEQIIRSLLIDLAKRIERVMERLSIVSEETELREYAIFGASEIAKIPEKIEEALKTENMEDPEILEPIVNQKSGWERRVDEIEYYLLPALERYNDLDRCLSRMCRRMTEQINWPEDLQLPLVAGISSSYFVVLSSVYLITIPQVDGVNPLTLPDLCHELGHIIIAFKGLNLWEEVKVATYKHYAKIFDPDNFGELLDLWAGSWFREFSSDMIATYLCGESFGWQNIRLCVNTYSDPFSVFASHPADDARMRGIVEVLKLLDRTTEANKLWKVWNEYAFLTKQNPEADYSLYFPTPLIKKVAKAVTKFCRDVGLRECNQLPDDEKDILAYVDRAWKKFNANPESIGALIEDFEKLISA